MPPNHSSDPVVIVSAARTPMGAFQGDFASLSAHDLGGVAIAGGLGPLTGKAFRIGHLGDSNPATILGCLGAVQAALQVQGIPVGAGALDRAVASLVANGG